MPRRISAARVKTHRSYRIDQLADIVGVTVQTVRTWCKEGLPCLTDQRPFLILGRDFKDWHGARTTTRKRPLGRFEVFCLGCKRAQSPLHGLVDHEPMDGKRGRIIAICPHCERVAHRIVAGRDLPEWAATYGFAINRREDA